MLVESFYHPLRVEGIHGERFLNRKEMRKGVFEDIKVNYNGTDLQSTNGFISPEAFETKQVT